MVPKNHRVCTLTNVWIIKLPSSQETQEIWGSRLSFKPKTMYAFKSALLKARKGNLKSDFSEYSYAGNQDTLFAFWPYQPFMFSIEGDFNSSAIYFHPDFFCIHKHHDEIACHGVLLIISICHHLRKLIEIHMLHLKSYWTGSKQKRKPGIGTIRVIDFLFEIISNYWHKTNNQEQVFNTKNRIR